jgi:ATP-dependent Lon protease
MTDNVMPSDQDASENSQPDSEQADLPDFVMSVQKPALAGDDPFQIPAELPILPLRGLVVYPQTAVPLMVGQPRSIRLIDDVVGTDRIIGLVASHDPDVDEPMPDELNRIGAVALVHRLFRAPDGTMRLLVQGIERIRIGEFSSTEPYLKASVEALPEVIDEGIEIEALMRNIGDQFRQLGELVPSIPGELLSTTLAIDDPVQFVYTISTYMRISLEDAQRILETDPVSDKLRMLMGLLSKELEVLELGRKIQADAQSEIDKVQREYYLREQLKAIQRELGESDEQQIEIEEFRRKIAESGMPHDVEKEAVRELDRLSKLPTAAAEYGVIRTYLDWLTSLPWTVTTEDQFDISHARNVLNEDHYDLEDIKERILEYLAVRKLRHERGFDQKDEKEPDHPVIRREREGVILCFVGPPGVGKTSLGASIARALGRKFIRMSLGACAMRQTYAGIGVPISVQCRGALSKP